MYIALGRCCCCSLRTGTKVICTLNLISGALGISIGAALLCFLTGLENCARNKGLLVISILSIVISIFVIVSSILAIIAACKNRKPLFIMIWLVVNAVSVTIGFVFYQCWGISSILSGAIYVGAGHIVVCCVAGVISFYFRSVVFNYYHELTKKLMESPMIGTDSAFKVTL